MTLLQYIEKYGEFTFSEKEFNEVDNVIFSVLTYINFEEIISKNKKNKKKLNQAATEYFNKYTKKHSKYKVCATRNAIKVLKAIKDKKRYKDLLLYNYRYIGSEDEQFSAITIKLYSNTIYISFEGTDELLSGWEEDAKMTYMFPVEAQKNAIKYLNEYSNTKDKIIVGGHSKGGNLALVASMYCTSNIQDRILNVYNNDGPGLRLKQIDSVKYKKIHDKLIHLIPNYSIVGLMLTHKKYTVIEGSKKNMLAHNPITWVVDDNSFKRVILSKFSTVLDKGITRWIDKYDDDIRKEFIKSIFDVCRNMNVKSLEDIKKNKLLFIKLLRMVMKINPELKGFIKDLISIINKCSKEYSKDLSVK